MFEVWFDTEYYSHNRVVRDRRPYHVVKEDDRVVVIHNVLGLDKDDITIERVPIDNRKSYLVITGTTKEQNLSDEDYSIKSRFIIKHNEIDVIEKKVLNGVLYLNIIWKKIEKPSIDIVEI